MAPSTVDVMFSNFPAAVAPTNDNAMADNSLLVSNDISGDGVGYEFLANSSLFKPNARKQLLTEVPEHIQKIIERRDLQSEYNALTNALYDSASKHGCWKSHLVYELVATHQACFEAKDVSVVFCKKKAEKKFGAATRWLCFIDRRTTSAFELTDKYRMEFGHKCAGGTKKHALPEGVCGEKLDKLERVSQFTPADVLILLKAKDAEDIYMDFADQLATLRTQVFSSSAKSKYMLRVVEEFEARFKAKGIGFFLCWQCYWVSHGNGYMEYVKWAEYVDLERQPDYKSPDDFRNSLDHVNICMRGFVSICQASLLTL